MSQNNFVAPGIRQLLAESAYLLERSRQLQHRAGAASARLDLAVQRSVLRGLSSSHPSRPEVIVWRERAWRCELWSIADRGVLRVFCGNELRHEETQAKGAGYERAQQLRELVITSIKQGERLAE